MIEITQKSKLKNEIKWDIKKFELGFKIPITWQATSIIERVTK